MSIVAVVGNKKSGKTTTVEILVQGLAKKGYRITTAKHIPEADFSIDTKGKDTWRHAKAGASTVISISPKEIAVVKKVDMTKYGLKEIIKEYQDEADIIILEGFSKITEQDSNVPKIVAVKTNDEIRAASKRFKPILAFAGPISTEPVSIKIPYVNRLKDPQKLINLVDKEFGRDIKRRKKRQLGLKIQIDGKSLPMKPFVQKIIKSSLLAMISTLKNTAIKGNEKVFITIEKSR